MVSYIFFNVTGELFYLRRNQDVCRFLNVESLILIKYVVA